MKGLLSVHLRVALPSDPLSGVTEAHVGESRDALQVQHRFRLDRNEGRSRKRPGKLTFKTLQTREVLK